MVNNKKILIQTMEYNKNLMIVDIKLFERGQKAIRKKITLSLTKLILKKKMKRNTIFNKMVSYNKVSQNVLSSKIIKKKKLT